MSNQLNIITTTEAAIKLGISQSRVRQLIRDGQLEATKINSGVWLLDTNTFNEFAKKPRPAGRPKKS